jgi:hypothetical protein
MCVGESAKPAFGALDFARPAIPSASDGRCVTREVIDHAKSLAFSIAVPPHLDAWLSKLKIPEVRLPET